MDIKIEDTMDIKIEKGIEPPPQKKAGRNLLYPFDKMEVGDSFEIQDPIRFMKAVHAAANYGRRHGQVFNNQPETMRIWRIK